MYKRWGSQIIGGISGLVSSRLSGKKQRAFTKGYKNAITTRANAIYAAGVIPLTDNRPALMRIPVSSPFSHGAGLHTVTPSWAKASPSTKAKADTDTSVVVPFDKRKQEALLEWIEEQELIPPTIKGLCKAKIEKMGLRFGTSPFDTESDSQDFFANRFGKEGRVTREIGAEAFLTSQRHFVDPVVPVPGDEELSDLIIEWLNDTVEKNSSEALTVGHPSHLMTEFQEELKFVARQDTIDCLHDEFQRMFELTKTMEGRLNKDENKFLVLRTQAGAGKTRLQIETSKAIESWLKGLPHAWHTPIVWTYNTGNPPTENEVGTDGELRQNELAFRVLFYAIKLKSQQSVRYTVPFFKNFLNKVRENEWAKHVTMTTAVSVIRKLMDQMTGRKANSSKRGVIFLGLDEFDLLVKENESIEVGRKPLKETVDAIGKVMKSGDEDLFVFTLLTGTPEASVEKLLTRSQHLYDSLPFLMFTPGDFEEVAFDCASRKKWPRNWCPTHIWHFQSEYGRLARATEFLLSDLQASYQAGRSELDYTRAIKRIQTYIATHRLGKLAPTILADVMLRQEINRDAVVNGKIDETTYDEWEAQGCIFIESKEKGTKYFVALSHMMMAQLESALPPGSRLRPPLQRMINLSSIDITVKNPEKDSRDLTWEQFEKVVLNCSALREMLLFQTMSQKQGIPVPLADLSELYPASIGSKEVLSRKFEISETVILDDTAERTTGELLIHQELERHTKGAPAIDYMFLSTKGAAFDGVYDRYMVTSQGKRVLHRICMQYRFYMDKQPVSLEQIEDEATKVNTAMLGSDFEKQYTLVFVVMKHTPTLEKDQAKIPDNCIILYGSAVQEFFGPAFSYRLLGQPNRISKYSVNAEPEKTLWKKVPGIGNGLARKICAGRPWRDWDELKAGVDNLQSKSRPYLTFY